MAAVLRPYSTAEHELGRALRKRGRAGLAVVPANRAAWGMTGPPPDPADWWRVVTEPDQPGDLAALLAGFGTVDVLAGDETAVPLAWEVASKLGLPGNDPARSGSCTDKLAMQQALETAEPRVPHPVTIGAAGPRTVLTAAQTVAQATRWPIVIKPRWSASSVGVSVCYTLDEVAAAWDAISGQPGALGEITRAVAVQEYLSGTKWTVDTVTVPGPDGRPVHRPTSFWREWVSVTSGIIWGESWLVPPAVTDPRHPALRVAAYARQVLDAVGVRAGPACTEIVLTARGPRLVEVMARLAGCYPVGLVELVTGQNQVTATVDALTDPAALARRAPAAGDGRAVAQVWLAAPYDGWLDGGVLQQITGLPTVQTHSAGLKDGAEVHETTDTPSSPGHLDLLGKPADVEQDITAIRTLEHTLYRRRP